MIKTLKKVLTSNTETEVLEFKQAKNQSQAWLLFGIDNDRNIVGTSISDKQLKEYKGHTPKNKFY